MAQLHTVETVMVFLGTEIKSLIGDTITQIDYFNADVDQHYREIGEEKKKEFFIRIMYHGNKLEIDTRFDLTNPLDKKTIPLACDWLYEDNPNVIELGERLGKHMRKYVGNTITEFLKNNKPSKEAE